MIALVPVALSVAGFSTLHAVLKKGRTSRALRNMFKRRQDAGTIPSKPSAEILASQAEARIVNEVHNVVVVSSVFLHIRFAVVPCYMIRFTSACPMNLHIKPQANW